MANLVSTPWDQRNAKPGFGYAGGTQNILTAFNGLLHRGANVRYANSQILLQEQLQDLYRLKEALEKEEDAFFRLFGIDKVNKVESFLVLKEKIEAWNETGAWKLINDSSINNEFYRGLEVLRREAVFAEITPEDWDNILTESLDTEEVRILLQENPNFNIAEVLNQILNKKGKGRFSEGKNSTLLANFTIELDDKGAIKINSNKEKISPSLQLKVMKELKQYLQIQRDKKNIVPYKFEKMLNDLFATLKITETGRKYIKLALRDYQNVLSFYAFNSDINQIKGFLGEVYNNAFLYFMANGSKNNKEVIDKITPTGAKRDLRGSKPEIVIDTWLGGFGIQVKNYEKNKVLREGYKIFKHYQVGNFITEALELEPTWDSGRSSVADVLLNFFTAYDYNQDYGKQDPSVKYSEAYKYWLSDRRGIESKMSNGKNFTEIFTPYISKLLGVEKNILTEDGMFQGRQYHNTFFNISGNYVPSSVIVQAIIDIINEDNGRKLINALQVQFSAPKHKESGLEKWNPAVDNDLLSEIFRKRLEYANASGISYTITVDIQALLQNIYQQIF